MPKAAKNLTDIQIQNQGSLILLKPTSECGAAWLEENIGQDNGYQPLWPTVLVEPRYASAVIQGATAEGLVVS